MSEDDQCFIIHDMDVHHETGEATLHLFHDHGDGTVSPAGTLIVQKEFTDHWFDNPFVRSTE